MLRLLVMLPQSLGFRKSFIICWARRRSLKSTSSFWSLTDKVSIFGLSKPWRNFQCRQTLSKWRHRAWGWRHQQSWIGLPNLAGTLAGPWLEILTPTASGHFPGRHWATSRWICCKTSARAIKVATRLARKQLTGLMEIGNIFFTMRFKRPRFSSQGKRVFASCGDDVLRLRCEAGIFSCRPAEHCKKNKFLMKPIPWYRHIFQWKKSWTFHNYL